MLNSKEAITIILWYVIILLCFATFQSVFLWERILTLAPVTFISTIILYTLFGLLADVFIGRYKLIRCSLWVVWLAMLTITFTTALLSEYQFPEWLHILLVLVPSVAGLLGFAAFQVTAVQFGTDQLQGAPSDHLSAFIFWYFMMEMLTKVTLLWIVYLLPYSVSNYGHIQLGLNSISVLFLSIVLCLKSCFMSNWFSTETFNPGGDEPGNSNPYRLVYRVLRFAQKHDHPVPVSYTHLTLPTIYSV